ncbi:MAG: bidirectional hydrogenase complex protein HoxE [Desulfobacteraceae bacterium]|nr:bidirectional hydrogenase complex protein HoxE [Desulfobacteraceae bacterium]
MPEASPKKDAGNGKPAADPRYKGIDRVLKRQQYKQDALIEVLTAAQEAFGYLPEEVMIYIARQLKLPFSWVYGVATFYHFFSLKPQGKHNAIVCLGTACYVGRANEIVDAISKEFNVDPGQTTPDGELTLTTTRCLGCCGLAPVVVFENQVLGKESPDTTVDKIRSVLSGAAPAATGATRVEQEEPLPA